MFQFDERLYALIGTILGGVGVKIFDWLSSKNKHKIDDAAKIRQELWDEVSKLRGEITSLRSEVDEWKMRYYELYAENAELRNRCLVLEGELGELRAGLNKRVF